MLLYQRVCWVLAQEGFSGLYRRARKKFTGYHTEEALDFDQQIATAKQDYGRLIDDFAVRTRELGHADEVRDYYWYHTLDLGNGLVTPGDFDYRQLLHHYQFPADLTGQRVLDVGSATGFFAFEFEKRGAQVLSVELPALADWDMAARDRDRILQAITARYHAATPEQAYQRVLDGPFQFCHGQLQSNVQRHYSTIYDLSPQSLGTAGFDLVYMGDVFSHLLSPLKALDVLATLCRGKLVLALDLMRDDEDRPHMTFVADPDGRGENRSWWVPNFTCVEQMLRSVGFRKVEIAGQFSGVLRRCWERYQRFVIHAQK
jgi:tRNA (mo5U34)-methyltransferase